MALAVAAGQVFRSLADALNAIRTAVNLEPDAVLYVADSTRTLFFVNVHTPPGVLMAKIVVFSTAGCQHCSKAKALLAGKGALCEHTTFLQDLGRFFSFSPPSFYLSS